MAAKGEANGSFAAKFYALGTCRSSGATSGWTTPYRFTSKKTIQALVISKHAERSRKRRERWWCGTCAGFTGASTSERKRAGVGWCVKSAHHRHGAMRAETVGALYAWQIGGRCNRRRGRVVAFCDEGVARARTSEKWAARGGTKDLGMKPKTSSGGGGSPEKGIGWRRSRAQSVWLW